MGIPTITYAFTNETVEYRPVIFFLFNTIEQRLNVQFSITEIEGAADIIFGETYPLRKEIYKYFLLNKPCEAHFIKGIHIYKDDAARTLDPLGSMFYILNCLSEPEAMKKSTDPHGRLTFKESDYSKFHNSYSDLITPLMRIFLKNYAGMEFADTNCKRNVILTHDVDFLRSGFRQELSYFFKKPGFSLAWRLLLHLLSIKKLWSNIESVIELEKKFDYHSVFYFIPKNGTFRGIKNADYKKPCLKRAMDLVYRNKMECGLHKSSYDMPYHEEVYRLGHDVWSNRNHFLRYDLPRTWREISDSFISIDTGLGWSDQEGLRNGYPAPFNPYGTQLTVVPLVIMDTTFDNYKKGRSIVQAFKEMEKEWTDGYCVSILFHNNFLTPWSNKYYLDQYMELLEYFKKEGVEVTRTACMMKKFQPRINQCI